ncbi:DUF1302 domain-containing protein [Castellaniella defragrans]|uniref:DUF1302 domain-containing protein n=1 Tax=Castellaniella defragrans TaxID=75697 RepID=A0A7W9TLT2_CASDE|nr:DUF1302 family protein [Castellaniella defragrans]MBB6082979.1 hypothetical protein [Castellaniella defragrans]
MENTPRRKRPGAARRLSPHPARWAAAAALIGLAIPPLAGAFQIETDDPELRVLWDTTVKYSLMNRLENPDSRLLVDPDQDDGDRNFRKGLVSNRLDVFSELDISKRGWGARVSGAAWYDTLYHGSNDNDSPGTVNHTSADYDRYTSGTRNLMGQHVELLDAFVFGKFDLGSAKANFRLGKHTVIYGESLFLAPNSLAGVMAPVDAVKAASVPGSQTKEILMPVNQISGNIQITPELMVGAYYQLEWRKARLPASGSYFSTGDLLDDGGEIFYGPGGLRRSDDTQPGNSGQGGIQVRYRVNSIETDFGFYALRYNEKFPTPTGDFATGQYWLDYHTGAKAYGISATRTFGNVNLATEFSIRKNVTLANRVPVFYANGASVNGPYPVGDTAHWNISWLASLGPSFVAREADFVGEIAWNRTLSVTRGHYDENASRDAFAIRFIYEPKYRQVLDGLDISIPINIGASIGKSSAIGNALGGHRTGDISIGVAGVYLGSWKGSLNYTHYFGRAATETTNGIMNWGQYYADRDYISASISHTF